MTFAFSYSVTLVIKLPAFLIEIAKLPRALYVKKHFILEQLIPAGNQNLKQCL